MKNFELRRFDSETRYAEAHALTHDKIAIGSIEGEIQLWNTITGEKLSSLREHSDLPDQPLDTASRLFLLGRKQILALAFSPNGTQLASGSKDHTVRLWDNASDSQPIVLQKHTGWTNVLAFSPNGKILASGSTDKTVQLWNTDTGEPIATLTGHLNGINALAFSPDGTTLASGSTDGTLRFWNVKTGDVLATRITGHTEWVKGVTFSKESSTLASVAFNGAITFWDVKTSQKTTHQIKGHRDWLATLAFSPDGTRLASIGAESTLVVGFGQVTNPDSLLRLTDVNTGREVATLQDKKGVSNLTFSPDGKTVAFSNHGNIRLWNTETDSHLDISLLDQTDVHKASLRERVNIEIHANGDTVIPQGIAIPPGMRPHQLPRISALVFSPDGTRLVSATMAGSVQMWDPETGIELTSFVAQDLDGAKHEVKDGGMVVTTTYKDPISVLVFSPNGKLLAAGSHQQIRLWNMETGNWGKGIISIDAYKDGREVFHGCEALVFSPDNTTLINGDGNGRIQLWDMATGDELVTFNGHMDGVGTLKFSPDGKTLVSAGQDGTILLWEWDEILQESSTMKE